MKVIHIINSLGTGGAEKLLADIVLGMSERGIDVTLLTLGNADGIYINQLLEKEIKIITLNKSRWSPLIFFKLMKILKNYDVVHSHLFPSQYWVALVSQFRKNNTVFITTEHSTYNKRRAIPLFRIIERFFYSKYDAIICISRKTSLFLEQWLGFKKNNLISEIPNGINLNFYKNSTPANLYSSSKKILMVARFNESKDHKTLINAINILKNEDIKLFLAGDGPLKKEIQHYVASLSLSNRVEFLGVRSDIPNIINSVDICVLSSNWEGFGLVAVEYMAAGKPTIVSDVEGLADVVRGAGVLFPPKESECLAREIKKLLDDSLYYSEISLKCKERASLYSIDNTVKEYLKIYNRYINEKQ